jgi:hypothetical protein
MKRLSEHSNADLLALSDDQLKTLIDLECAMNSVPLLPPEPVEPVKPDIQPNRKMYQVANVLFETYTEACSVVESFLKTRMFNKTYLPGGSYSKYSAEPMEEYSRPKVEEIMVFSQEHWAKVKDLSTKYDEEKRAYEALESQYKTVKKQVDEIADEIYEKVGAARNEAYQQEQALTLYERYLKLMDGNEELASRCFQDANPELYQVFNRIVVE